MTFGGRIRLYLVIVAVAPSLLLLGLVYYFVDHDRDLAAQIRATSGLAKFEVFQERRIDEIVTAAKNMARDPDLMHSARTVATRQPTRFGADPRVYGLDFAEIVDSLGIVRTSFHRPGLVNQPLTRTSGGRQEKGGPHSSIEYDLDGLHLATACRQVLADGVTLYAGQYFDQSDIATLSDLMEADVRLVTEPDSQQVYRTMAAGEIYRAGDRLRSLLIASQDPPVYLVADFDPPAPGPQTTTMLSVALLVAVLAGLIAVGLGVIITGRAQREIDNLVQASSRVAGGDLSTPVMAYEEGEFSLLADSLSEMMTRLQKSQRRLAAAQKIAAWQQVGRKVAHEIKNPLTPISIGVDDLRLSYREERPDFGDILEQTTGAIKEEVERITKLLDQFVGFARMRSPEPRPTGVKQWLSSLTALYAAPIGAGQLSFEDDIRIDRFNFDSEALKQVAINLIKNGLEAGNNSSVTVTISCRAKQGLVLRFEDSGPGFDQERLDDPFRPFVTSKESGSGLGLVVALRIVQDHGGQMELYNRDGGGGGVLIEIPET